MWKDYLNHLKKLNELSKTTSCVARAGFNFPVITGTVTLVLADIASVKLGMTSDTIFIHIVSMSPSINEIVTIAIPEVKQILTPLVPVVNEVAPVVEMAKPGILNLVSWTDALNKAELSPSFTDGIKKTPELLSSYTGNIKLVDFSAFGQTIVNGSSNSSNLFFSGLSSSYLNKVMVHHTYYNSQYLIPFIPVLIISLRELFFIGCNIIHSMFAWFGSAAVRTYSWFLQILLKPKIKKIPGSSEDWQERWKYFIATSQSNQNVSNQARAINSGNTDGNNGNGSGSGSGNGNGDGNGDDNNGFNNYYQEFPRVIEGIVKLLKDIIAALKALLKIIESILSGDRLDWDGMINNLEIIEDGYPCWITNYWVDGYSDFHQGLLSSLHTLGNQADIPELIAWSIEGERYTVDVGESEISEFYNISSEGRRILSQMATNISILLPYIETELSGLLLVLNLF